MSWVIILLLLVFSLSSTPTINAASEYVLPYPSFMPGSMFYKVNLIKDEILKYWYFGSFGQFKYNLKQTDKYLVEAKTLFEYKQYLLGINALKKSDTYFIKIKPSLLKAKSEGKDINQSLLILKDAKDKHIETLERVSKEVPEAFVWEPEKEKPTNLNLHEIINESIHIRTNE